MSRAPARHGGSLTYNVPSVRKTAPLLTDSACTLAQETVQPFVRTVHSVYTVRGINARNYRQEAAKCPGLLCTTGATGKEFIMHLDQNPTDDQNK